jgi:DNA-binding NtrC family response regulator
MCGPLVWRGECLGVLYADRKEPIANMMEGTINMFAALCNLGSIALYNAATQSQLRRENEYLQQYLAIPAVEYPEIVGVGVAINEVRRKIRSAARSPLDVLITGESGTGKELVARALHRTGRRSDKNFTAVDCGSLSDSLIEAELFGFKKGAFTGAIESKMGIIEAANQGVLFLDEICNLPLRCQSKLLRMLQEREVRRIGESVARRVDVQVIAATNKDLRREIGRGRFREDLFHRLNAIEIYVPPLRERREDILILAQLFLERTIGREGGIRKRLSQEARQVLMAYEFPGNVRELKNCIESAYYSSENNTIKVEHLTSAVRECGDGHMDVNKVSDLVQALRNGGKFDDIVKKPFLRRQFGRNVLRELIEYGLKSSSGSYKKTFSLLNIPKNEYAVMMQFLKRHECFIDYRPYRRAQIGRRRN